MLYVAFSNYSHKWYAKQFCNKYKHCAPIMVNKNGVEIYQFVRVGKTVKINAHKSDLQKLEQHGWKLIKCPKYIHNLPVYRGLTCVQFTKRFCGIKDIWIQTPFALFKYLTSK